MSRQLPRSQLSLQVRRARAAVTSSVLAGLDWDSSSGDGDTYHASASSNQRLSAPWISTSPPAAAASRQQDADDPGCQASSRPLSLKPTVSAPSTARCDFVRTLSRVVEKTTATGSKHGVCSFLAWRAGMTLLWRSCTLIRKLRRTTRRCRLFVFQHQRFVLIKRTNRDGQVADFFLESLGPAREVGPEHIGKSPQRPLARGLRARR